MRATLVVVTRCLRPAGAGSTSLNTLTVQVHGVWIRLRDRYPYRESRREVFANEGTLFGSDITEFGVVSARDIHIGLPTPHTVARRTARLWVAQHFE